MKNTSISAEVGRLLYEMFELWMCCNIHAAVSWCLNIFLLLYLETYMASVVRF